MAGKSTVLAAFSAEQVKRIAGLTTRQLSYWDQTGFFSPQYASENRRSPNSRIYSFEDLVGLRTLCILKNDHNVTMPHLKEVARKLSRHTRKPWSEIKLMVWKRKVQWIEPDTGLPAGVVDGQDLMVEMAEIVADMTSAVVKERNREQHELGKISRHRFVAQNAPVVAGTRIPVRAIKRFSAAGYSVAQILSDTPTLTEIDVKAALAYDVSKAAA